MKRLAVLVLSVLFFMACRKGDLPEARYYGKVAYGIVDLPDKPKVVVRFNGITIDTLNGEGYKASSVLAGRTGKLSFYKAGTDSLIADTTITVAKDGENYFRIISSNDLNLNGFVPPFKPSADSFAVQFFMNLGDYYRQYPAFDLTIIYADNATGEIKEGETYKNVKNGVLDPHVHYLRFQDAVGPIGYAVELKDPATGEIITQPNGSTYVGFPSFSEVPQKLIFLNIKDDNGNVSDALPIFI